MSQYSQQIVPNKTINLVCSRNFETCFTNFKQQVDQLQENEAHSIQISDSKSCHQTQQIFRKIFPTPKGMLTRLKLLNVKLTENQVRIFTQNCYQNLTVLQIYSSKIDFECASLLAKCQMPNLAILNLAKCQINDQSLAQICNAKWQKMYEVNFSDNPLTPNSLKFISQTAWPNLEYIQITGSNNRFNESIQNPSPIFNFSKLKSINLSESKIAQQILTKIIKQAQPQLQILNVHDCAVSGKQLFNLNKNTGWSNLEQLIMGSQDIDSQDLSIGLSNICQQFLDGQKISKEFQKIIMESSDRTNPMQPIPQVDDCDIQQQSLNILAQSQWKQLKQLTLYNSSFADSSINSIVKSSWVQLQKLNIDETGITIFGSLWLAKKMGNQIQCVKFSDLLTLMVPSVIKGIFELGWIYDD